MASHALNEPDFAGPDARVSADRIGLAVAIGLHLAVVGLFFVNYNLLGSDVPPAERMTVSLASEVSLRSEGEAIVPESRAAVAPETAQEAETQPDAPTPVVEQPATTRAPERQPQRTATTTRTAQAQPPAPATPARPSRIGDNFLTGAGSSTATDETRVPASQIGASAKASLLQAISRKIRPNWQPPNGPDADQIVSYIRFRLNPDGSLSGRPELVRQTGITDTNRAQSSRHGELAIRAVQRAAPFDDLPPEYYEAWKLVGPLAFNWELSR